MTELSYCLSLIDSIMLKISEFHCFVLTIVLTLVHANLSAQNLMISGHVVDAEDQNPLVGVTVLNSSDGSGTATDIDGIFRLSVSPDDVVVFRYVGYAPESKTFRAGEDTVWQIARVQQVGKLYEVVVTGSKYEKAIGEETVSIEVLGPQLIESSNNVTIESSIQKIPGVNVIDGQANIRGGSGYSYGAGSRVLLLMDDIPLLTADAALANWNFVPMENIGQIEVIKGAASALYGSSALNGIINVRTAYPLAEPETRITMFSGIYDSPSDTAQRWWGNDIPFFTGVNASHRQKFDRFDLVAGAYVYANESYLQHDHDRFGRINIQTRYRVNSNLTVGLNSVLQLNRSVSFFYWNNLDSGLYVPADNTMTINQGTRMAFDPFVQYYDGAGNKHKLQGRFYKSDNRTQTEQGVLSDLYYGEYQFQRRLPVWNMVVTAGLTANRGMVNAELYGDTSYVATNQAAYLQLDKTFFGKWQVNGGVRYEQNQLDNLDEARPVVRIGSSYQLADFTFLRASWGQGYRFPTVAEKFINTSVSLFNIYPNPDLESETGWTAEVGLKQGLKINGWQAYADVSAFVSRYFNMMEFTFGYYPENGGVFPYGFKSLNIGNTEIRGLEFSIAGEGKIGNLPLTLLAGYTYIDPQFQDFDSLIDAQSTADFNVLKYRFRHVVKWDMLLPMEHFRPGLEVNYNSYMEAIDEVFNSFISGLAEYREMNTNGETVVNVRAGYAFNDNTEIFFICNNVFNNMYMLRPAYMEPVRNFTFRFTHKL